MWKRPGHLERVMDLRDLIDAITALLVDGQSSQPQDPWTDESLDPRIFLLRMPQACAALGVSKHRLTAMARSVGLARWPFPQLRRARALAVDACREMPRHHAITHIRPVVRDALVLGSTKRHK